MTPEPCVSVAGKYESIFFFIISISSVVETGFV
jgi:hypothetical protein